VGIEKISCPQRILRAVTGENIPLFATKHKNQRKSLGKGNFDVSLIHWGYNTHFLHKTSNKSLQVFWHVLASNLLLCAGITAHSSDFCASEQGRYFIDTVWPIRSQRLANFYFWFFSYYS
jgi:hypothetical protein